MLLYHCCYNGQTSILEDDAWRGKIIPNEKLLE